MPAAVQPPPTGSAFARFERVSYMVLPRSVLACIVLLCFMCVHAWHPGLASCQVVTIPLPLYYKLCGCSVVVHPPLNWCTRSLRTLNVCITRVFAREMRSEQHVVR